MSNSRKDRESMPKRLFDAVGVMNKLILRRDDTCRQIETELEQSEQDYYQILNNINNLSGSKLAIARKRDDARAVLRSTKEFNRERKHRVREEFNKDWVSALINLDDLCKRVRQCQLPLNELTAVDINTGTHFPDSLAFGRMCLTYQNWKGYIPRLIPFPFTESLWLPDQTTGPQWIHQLMLRLMHSMPIGTVEITAADPLRLGKSLGPFLPLLSVKRLFPEQTVLTDSDELDSALAQLTDNVKDLLQNRFKGEIKDWAAYNAADCSNPIPYRLLLIFGVPENLTEKSLSYLGRLLEHGPDCGVIPVMTIDENRLEDSKFAGLRTAIDKHSKRMDFIVSARDLTKHFSEFSVVEKHEFWPRHSDLEDFLAFASNQYEQSSKFSKDLPDLWCNSDYWQYDTVQGLQVPIGWAADGEIVPLLLGSVNAENHVLLAGRSGSGKSNLLHVLIHSLCHNYSPSELKLYLLDFKQGTEFNVYASPTLPQAKLVAKESDPKYGVTVLEYLAEELDRRSREFKSRDVTEFHQYREYSELPRILLIIDEFQVLFSEGQQTAGRAAKNLRKLHRQGRGYGIHVVLATQTLSGIETLALKEMTSQIGCRIALACTQDDSQKILATHNIEASEIKSPPWGIINNHNGAKSENQRFRIPKADPILRKDHIAEIRRIASHRGYSDSTRVFEGARLPDIPDSDWYNSKSHEALRLHLGVHLSFEAKPLSLTLVNRPSSNLLISGSDDAIHDGLLASILQSLDTRSDGIEEIIYFNGRSIDPKGISTYFDGPGKRTVVKYENVPSLNLVKISEKLQQSSRILIIDGLDWAKEFCPVSTGVGWAKKDEPPSAHESLKKILEDGPPHGTFVIAFADDWRRCSLLGNGLLNFFGLRVGFSMNEADAGSLVYGLSQKPIEGLETGNCAVFANRLVNQVDWFRPYINRECL